MDTLRTNDRLRRAVLRLLGEVAVIVLGVLIALWVDSLRAARIDTEARTELLEALATETSDNLSELNATIAIQDTVLTALREIIAIHDGRAPIPNGDSATWLVNWATSYKRITPTFSVYDAMVATGSSRLLPAETLGRRLARHRAELQAGQGDEPYAERAFESFTESTVPYGGLLPYLFRETADRIGLVPVEQGRDVEALLSDRNVADRVFRRLLFEHNITAWYRSREAEIGGDTATDRIATGWQLGRAT